MSTDKMRAAFEAWAKSNGYDCHWQRADSIAAAGYERASTHHAWTAWQAAYAAGLTRGAEICRDQKIHWRGDCDETMMQVALEQGATEIERERNANT